MTLRMKTLILFSAALVIMLAVLFGVSRNIVLGGFSELEQKDATTNIERAQSVLSDDLKTMESTIIDWANWNDTYNWVNGEYNGYIEDNINPEALINLDVNMMLFLDTSGEIFYASNIDIETEKEVGFPQGLIGEYLKPDAPFLNHPDEQSSKSGIIVLPEGPLMIASGSILKSDRSGPQAGVMIVGRFLNSDKLKDLSDQTRLSLTIHRFDDPQIPADVREAKSSLTKDSPTLVETLDSDTIAGYALMNDVNGDPALIIKAKMDRDIFQRGQATLSYFMFAIAGIGLVFGGIAVVGLDRSLLSRLSRLSNGVVNIGSNKNPSERVEARGTDELGRLAVEINDMLESLEQRSIQLDAANLELEATNSDLVTTNRQLDATNKELESFSYSVSHDLRAPLRALDGFSEALLEDYSDKLDDEGKEYLGDIRYASNRMGELIDDLLTLSRVTRGEMTREQVDISEISKSVAEILRSTAPDRNVDFSLCGEAEATGDPRLLRVLMENLLGNAWKYTGKQPNPRIEFGVEGNNGTPVYFVRDNGAGFDEQYSEKLFAPFQRLHSPEEFEGTGIGLATVQRIINRHGGRIWAEGSVDKGATFHFTLS